MLIQDETAVEEEFESLFGLQAQLPSVPVTSIDLPDVPVTSIDLPDVPVNSIDEEIAHKPAKKAAPQLVAS